MLETGQSRKTAVPYKKLPLGAILSEDNLVTSPAGLHSALNLSGEATRGFKSERVT